MVPLICFNTARMLPHVSIKSEVISMMVILRQTVWYLCAGNLVLELCNGEQAANSG